MQKFTQLETQSAGARRILEERNDHFTTHGFDEDHDKKNNAEELKYAAVFLLNPEKYKGVYPSWWSEEWKQKFLALSPKERLVKAGALLAAEYDRLEAEERISAGSGSKEPEKADIPQVPAPDVNMEESKETEKVANETEQAPE